MIYEPKPIDTSKIKIDDELMKLIELLSKNTHEVWAKERIKQGWSYGKERNDLLKEHPCLISYEELSEEEKIYDRNTALETLKVICSLGYKLSTVKE